MRDSLRATLRAMAGRRVRGPEHAAASPGGRTARAAERGPFRVLVGHLFGSFFAGGGASRVVHAAVGLGVAPVLVTLGLAGSYSGLVPWMGVRPYELRVQDHFLYVAYAGTVVGVASLLAWEAFFPTLLDVYVLGLLPIRRLFWAKVAAGVMFVGLFVVGANLGGALLLPGIAGSPSFWRQVVAHCVATGLAGCFATAFPLGVLALSGLVLGVRVNRWLAPLLQGGAIAGFAVLLFVSPLLASFARPDVACGTEWLRWLPPFWFLGVYEVVQGASPEAHCFAGLARMGWLASGGSVAALLVLYPLAYRRKSTQLLEGEVAKRVAAGWWMGMAARVRGLAVRAPRQRAAWCFAGQTLLRVARFRIGLAVAASLGMAVAVWPMASLAAGHGYPVLRWQAVDPVRAAGVVVMVLTGGVFVAMSTAEQPAAGWIFASVLGAAGDPGRAFTSGTRRWVGVFACGVGAVALVGALAVARLLGPGAEAGVAARQMVTVLAWGVLVAEVFFVPFRDVPFAGSRLRERVNGILCGVYACGVFPAAVWGLGVLGRRCSGSWVAVGVWVAGVAGVCAALSRWYEEVDLRPWVGEEEVQRLGL